MKRTIIKFLLLCLLIGSGQVLSGCAKAFSIGHENFKCVGDAESGRCLDPMAIYENKSDIVYGKKFQNSKDKDKKEEKKQEVKVVKGNDLSLKKPNTDIMVENYIPIRKTEKVLRIYVAPFVNKKGNLIQGFWLYTVSKDGQWVIE